MRAMIVVACTAMLATGCSKNSPPQQTATPAAPAKPRLGIRPAGDETIKPDLSRVSDELKKRVQLHRRPHRRSRRESAEMGPPAEHLQQRRRHSRVGRDGEGILRAARLPGVARLRRRHHGVGRAGQSGRLREVRRRRAADDRDLLAVRHDADHAARRVEGAAVRRTDRRAAAVQEGADRPRRRQFEGARARLLERADVDQGGHRQAAGEHRLRRGRRRRAHGHRAAQVRQGSSGLLQERRRADRRRRRSGAERRRGRRRRI